MKYTAGLRGEEYVCYNCTQSRNNFAVEIKFLYHLEENQLLSCPRGSRVWPFQQE